ncbi:hypothetical protein [Sporosarcina gallistercoris]|uniref:Uncharacterized protein n=1 Tax=Sporosarcina gallistercoris TaxID=2762245 RepID=A0ABR8PMA4_9BACL|nr:hypothetical protein [Sporosarcina gallistercoris]MBD7909306.1 hypothetical protein [Sporosarcina gallistercoris]
MKCKKALAAASAFLYGIVWSYRETWLGVGEIIGNDRESCLGVREFSPDDGQTLGSVEEHGIGLSRVTSPLSTSEVLPINPLTLLIWVPLSTNSARCRRNAKS